MDALASGHAVWQTHSFGSRGRFDTRTRQITHALFWFKSHVGIQIHASGATTCFQALYINHLPKIPPFANFRRNNSKPSTSSTPSDIVNPVLEFHYLHKSLLLSSAIRATHVATASYLRPIVFHLSRTTTLLFHRSCSTWRSFFGLLC